MFSLIFAAALSATPLQTVVDRLPQVVVYGITKKIYDDNLTPPRDVECQYETEAQRISLVLKTAVETGELPDYTDHQEGKFYRLNAEEKRQLLRMASDYDQEALSHKPYCGL